MVAMKSSRGGCMKKTHALTRRSFHPGSLRCAVVEDHAVSQPKEHDIKANQAQRLAVELAHLAEHIGLLDALDDQPVLDPDVVEEAGLERALSGRGAVQPPGRCPVD